LALEVKGAKVYGACLFLLWKSSPLGAMPAMIVKVSVKVLHQIKESGTYNHEAHF
jgi:hypothetical protein